MLPEFLSVTKLSIVQRLVLSRAAMREDGVAELPEKMRRAAALGVNLVARNLAIEVEALSGMPVWRTDLGGRPVSLVITAKGRRAIGVPSQSCKGDASVVVRDVATGRVIKDVDLSKLFGTAVGAKQALAVRMLSRRGGATLKSLSQAMGWRPHTTRARMSDLKRQGFKVDRRDDGGGSIYWINRGFESAPVASARSVLSRLYPPPFRTRAEKPFPGESF